MRRVEVSHPARIGFYLLYYSVSTGPNPMRACRTHLNAVFDVWKKNRII